MGLCLGSYICLHSSPNSCVMTVPPGEMLTLQREFFSARIKVYTKRRYRFANFIFIKILILVTFFWRSAVQVNRSQVEHKQTSEFPFENKKDTLTPFKAGLSVGFHELISPHTAVSSFNGAGFRKIFIDLIFFNYEHQAWKQVSFINPEIQPLHNAFSATKFAACGQLKYSVSPVQIF